MDDMNFRLPDSIPEDDDLEELAAAFTGDSIPKTRRFNEREWNEMQRARQEYLKEWEEDMRYAQELASEGM